MTQNAENQNPITTELAKQNVTEAVIKKLRADFLPLKISGVDDKENYKIVHDARIKCRDVRVLAEKICKKGREDANRISKEWIAKEKEVVAQISEIEQHLKKQEDAVDAAIEAQKIRIERLAKLPGRKEQMVGIETYIQGGVATIKDMADKMSEFNDEWIMSHDDKQWDQIILNAKSEKILEFEEKELERKEQERQVLIASRTNELIKAGAKRVTNGKDLGYKKGTIFYVLDSEIPEFEQKEWDDQIAEMTEFVDSEKEMDVLRHFTAEPPTKESYDGDKVNIGSLDEVGQTAEVSESSDEEKLFYFGGTIESLTRPIMKTEEGKKVLAKAEALITQAINILRK